MIRLMILARHEVFMVLIQYAVSLFIGGVICFKWLFPMIGQWIKDLAKRLKMREEEAEHTRKWLEQRRAEQEGISIRRGRHDDERVIDGLYMDEADIKSMYEGTSLKENVS